MRCGLTWYGKLFNMNLVKMAGISKQSLDKLARKTAFLLSNIVQVIGIPSVTIGAFY